MLTQYIIQHYFNNFNKVQYIKCSIQNENLRMRHKLYFTMVKPPTYDKEIINMQSDMSKNHIEYFANKRFISRNFMVKLINTYWQETIFLSRSDALSKVYVNQLQSDGIAIYKNQYKKFLLNFSKALVTGRIEVSLINQNDAKSLHSNISSSDIKYIWKKGFNFLLPKPRHFLKSVISNSKFKNLNVQQTSLLNELKNSNFPIFTLVNNSNQIIVAEPSEKLTSNQNPFEQLYQWYYNRFLWQQYQRPYYQALFFINPEDALEYQEYIEYKYRPINKNTGVHLFTNGIDFYYKLLFTSHPKIRLNLIPDLKELGKLIYEYQYKKNISFHSKQIYSKSSFKGQPIYFIEPVLVKHKYNKTMHMISYNYISHLNDQQKYYRTIFMNYKTALLAWNKFKQQHHDYRLPDKPRILVYNLEDFFSTYSNNTIDVQNRLLFIPTEESYKFLKSNLLMSSSHTIYERFIDHFTSCKVFINNIIWSLTSKQPVNL